MVRGSLVLFCNVADLKLRLYSLIPLHLFLVLSLGIFSFGLCRSIVNQSSSTSKAIRPVNFSFAPFAESDGGSLHLQGWIPPGVTNGQQCHPQHAPILHQKRFRRFPVNSDIRCTPYSPFLLHLTVRMYHNIGAVKQADLYTRRLQLVGRLVLALGSMTDEA